MFFEWTTAEFTGTWRSLVMTAPQNSAAVTDVTFHSTHRKGYQSKLLFFHSKGSRCSSWGLLHFDDRRSPWWASRYGPQRDRSRSDTGMISMTFNSYASLVIFFILLLLTSSLVPKFHFQLTWQSQREVPEKVKHIVQFSWWRDSFSSALCFILS